MRTGRSIRKEDLHVARAHVAPVDLVDRAHLALDAPRDLECLGVVVLRRSGSGRIIDNECHFRHVAAGA